MRLAVLAFAAGVLLLQQQAQLVDWRIAFGAALALVLCAAALWWLGRRSPSVWLRMTAQALALAAAFAAGFAWANTLAAERLVRRLPAALEGVDVQVTGIVDALPRADEQALRFILALEHIEPDVARPPRRLALSWYSSAKTPLPVLRVGERWRLTVRLKRPHGTANPHGFDFERWALERGIGAAGYVRDKSGFERLGDAAQPRYVIERWRERIRERFAHSLAGREYAAVLSALAIGEQSGITPAHWRLFWRSGIGHLVSISGLHITMVAALAGWVAAWLWRCSANLLLRVPAQRVAILAGAIAALFYAALAGFSVPTQRTVYMLGVVAAAWWFGWTLSPSRVLCAALLVVIVLDPWAVTAAGFWLSFGAVGAILYVSSNRDDHGASFSWLRNAARSQVAVTLLLAPLLLILFHQLPLASPLTNAIAIPVVSLLVVPLTLLGAVLPLDALLHAAHALFAWCMQPISWLSDWPAAVWTRAAAPLWSVVLALAGACWLLLPRGFPARWLGLLWLLPLALLPSARPALGTAALTVLDVGQGLAVVVETATRTLLYDAGPRYGEDASAGSRIALPYLRSRGVTRLDALIVSHEDDDHAGGALDAQSELNPSWLLSSLPAEHPVVARNSKAWRCVAGQRWRWDDVDFEVLAPPASAYRSARLRENALSCVLKVSSARASVLLPGDIEAAQERDLVQAGTAWLRSTALIGAHHGSKTSSSAEFLAALQPRLVVFTVGYRNRFQHPHGDVLQRVRESGAAIWRSDEHGAVTLELSAEGVRAQSYRLQQRRYWRD